TPLVTRLLSRSLSFPPSCYSAVPALRSFPTRRSSDLRGGCGIGGFREEQTERRHVERDPRTDHVRQRGDRLHDRPARHRALGQRSEEHTSELQSRENLVCRLLLEKKNTHSVHCVVYD